MSEFNTEKELVNEIEGAREMEGDETREQEGWRKTAEEEMLGLVMIDKAAEAAKRNMLAGRGEQG